MLFLLHQVNDQHDIFCSLTYAEDERAAAAIDLIKAFYLVNRKSLIMLLSKSGFPNPTIPHQRCV